MEIFETITAHSRAMKLPLYAVTLTALPVADTPLLLILHWHGFYRSAPIRIPLINVPPRSVPGSAVQFNSRWRSIDTLDFAMLDAGWQLGAWDIERASHRPWWRPGAPDSEVLACRKAFGAYPNDEADGEYLIAEAPDREEMMDLAARKGYIRWMFRPRKCGVWLDLPAEDLTVGEDGSRAPPCPILPHPYYRDASWRTVYRLGKAARLAY